MADHLTNPLSQHKEETVQKAFEFRKQQFFKDLERAQQEGSESLVVVSGEQFKHTRMNEVGRIVNLPRWLDWFGLLSVDANYQPTCPSESELVDETKILFEWLQQEEYKPVIELVDRKEVEELELLYAVYNTWGIVVRWN